MTDKSSWKGWLLAIALGTIITVAGDGLVGKIDMFDYRANALEREQAEVVAKLKAVEDLKLVLTRIETKLMDVAERLRRVETKLDSEAPARGRRR